MKNIISQNKGYFLIEQLIVLLYFTFIIIVVNNFLVYSFKVDNKIAKNKKITEEMDFLDMLSLHIKRSDKLIILQNEIILDDMIIKFKEKGVYVYSSKMKSPDRIINYSKINIEKKLNLVIIYYNDLVRVVCIE